MGFVFTEDDPVVGVDLDDCRDPETGDIDDTAQDIIERLDSYTEISPSGTGYHVLIKGELPEGRNRRGSVELYDTARFFTVTGDHVDVTPTHVARGQDALAAIRREYVQETEPDTASKADCRGAADDEASEPTVDLDNDELLKKARNASNGAKFERLWQGNTAGYDSQSEADMALCCLLAFWTGGDATWMDQLFRQSGLLREKWDDIHYADGSTYGEKTIERAIATTSEFYDPDETDVAARDGARSSSMAEPSTTGGQQKAYLVEKNRLLKERIEELESSLAQKNDRIDELEAMYCELREASTVQQSNANQVPISGKESGRGSESDSLWARIQRLIRRTSE